MAGVPWRMKSATCPISSVCIDDGSGTSSASSSAAIGDSGSTGYTSYCFRSSSTTGQDGSKRFCW